MQIYFRQNVRNVFPANDGKTIDYFLGAQTYSNYSNTAASKSEMLNVKWQNIYYIENII